MATQAILILIKRAAINIATKCNTSQRITKTTRIIGRFRLSKFSFNPKIAIFNTSLCLQTGIKLPRTNPIIDKTTILAKKDMEINEVNNIIKIREPIVKVFPTKGEIFFED